MTEKRPREYVSEIIAIPTAAGRRKALAKVPEKYRAWVEHSMDDHFERMRMGRIRG